MAGAETSSRRPKRAKKPLDRARIEEFALAYVARFATSASRLERYLARKLRERGWEGEGEPDIPALVSRYVELGYVDDEAFARARTGGLLQRGYGMRRVNQALGEAGIAEDVREEVAPGEARQRRAALAYVRKRRFGPFGAEPLERDRREKQLAAMLRAGHPFESAQRLIDAPNEDAAEEWAAEMDDEED